MNKELSFLAVLFIFLSICLKSKAIPSEYEDYNKVLQDFLINDLEVTNEAIESTTTTAKLPIVKRHLKVLDAHLNHDHAPAPIPKVDQAYENLLKQLEQLNNNTDSANVSTLKVGDANEIDDSFYSNNSTDDDVISTQNDDDITEETTVKTLVSEADHKHLGLANVDKQTYAIKQASVIKRSIPETDANPKEPEQQENPTNEPIVENNNGNAREEQAKRISEKFQRISEASKLLGPEFEKSILQYIERYISIFTEALFNLTNESIQNILIKNMQEGLINNESDKSSNNLDGPIRPEILSKSNTEQRDEIKPPDSQLDVSIAGNVDESL